MKIALIGSGAREHIIAEQLARSPQCDQLYVFGNTLNPGIEPLAARYHVGNLTDTKAIQAFVDEYRPDFAVVGPEAPLAAGVVDALLEIGIPSASPTQAMAQLESSKGFTRELLEKYGISGNPEFKVFTSPDGLKEFAESLGQIVVKADGLHGGKGVLVQGDHFETIDQGVEQARAFLKSDGQVVIEEKLVGQEFSLMSFVDGDHVIDMLPIQDHKRAYENDQGPNTGGMGTYSDRENLPFLEASDLTAAHQITVETAAALKKELGTGFKGIMYGGFMAVKNGVRLIEYNARFGDPEVMNALTLLKTDLVEVCLAIIHGTLDQLNIEFEKKATVCKYIVPKGYPENPVKGERIHQTKAFQGVGVYYASVEAAGDDWVLGGSRAMAFVAKADTLEEAEKNVQKAVESIQGPIFFRRDIGTKTLIDQRIEMMRALRK
ncbi:phosphoribosylamine--glycine ligase [Candidatus Peregrinibacteria bacterium]|nr:MAG: phosphoribosylamine--glycine ligase [Candidatus Peregrinibacteria bacterium]